MQRIDHQDGSTTFESPLHAVRLPPVAAIAAPPSEEEREERARRERMRIIEIQRSTLPADGNIGPSGRTGVPQHHADFLRHVIEQGLHATRRNLARLLEIDDDEAMRTLDIGLAQWEAYLASPSGR